MFPSSLYLTAKTLISLKEVPRSGWLQSGVLNPESVADHSWGTAILCLLFSDYYGVDPGRTLEIAVVHDAAEVITGDIPTTHWILNSPAKMVEKNALENDAIDKLFHTKDTARLRSLWEEYVESQSREAIVVRDLNLIDMALQAILYASMKHRTTQSLSQFIDSTKERLRLPESRPIFQLIEQDFISISTKVK